MNTLNPPVMCHTQQGGEKVRVQSETTMHAAQCLRFTQENVVHTPSAVGPEGEGQGRESYSVSVTGHAFEPVEGLPLLSNKTVFGELGCEFSPVSTPVCPVEAERCGVDMDWAF